MATIRGYVDRIVFRNEDNGYTVLVIIENGKEVTLTGTLPLISEGECLSVTGDETEHPVYGKQIRVQEYEFIPPNDEESTQRYLGSGVIKGIGESLAARIVKLFGDDTFRIIEEEPERLAEVKGISLKKAMEISAQIADKRDMRQAMMFLQDYGITVNLAAKIYKTYGMELYTIIKQNPYRLADDISGVGFKIADEIAGKVGITTDSAFRIKSGLLYVLQQAVTNGHTYLPATELVANTVELLNIDADVIEKHIMDLVIDKKVMVKSSGEEEIVYLSYYYYAELHSSRMLFDLDIKMDITDEEISKKLTGIEKSSGVELDKYQKMAVAESVKNGVLVITGGPGTGKTTTINTIIQYFMDEGMDILLAAPTGRAAKRMTEATGFEAQTIHRLLEITGVPDGDAVGIHFQKNEDNPLEADVVIIDEMSMVDINVFHALLRAILIGTRLIMVGDVNQLPSVGAGSVLKDIIQSHCFNVVMLNKIFRQASQSDIIVNAHKINAGQYIDTNKSSKDFLFIKRDNSLAITGATITLIKEKLPKYVHASMHDIQVLTPMRKGALGVEQLNTALQQYLNPPSSDKIEKEFAHNIFREGDKVMQIKNNYQIEWEVINKYNIPLESGTGVFNGDMGFIRDINLYSEELIVEFDEKRRVTYSFKQIDELELAYAITIHKSQGSEYPAVIIPLLSGPRMLMNRNILYTAVTRAKSCVCIVGSVETFQSMVTNEREQKRYSGLDERIKELCDMKSSLVDPTKTPDSMSVGELADMYVDFDEELD